MCNGVQIMHRMKNQHKNRNKSRGSLAVFLLRIRHLPNGDGVSEVAVGRLPRDTRACFGHVLGADVCYHWRGIPKTEAKDTVRRFRAAALSYCAHADGVTSLRERTRTWKCSNAVIKELIELVLCAH